ncbi:hypothetical protein BLNAU_23404 [Blattamonas nauphoetae]|uniref:Uncharacterized protein n=2 Tax=Blattamonas nauphoetae TaxID=2049346 RepID=A0ABQ9WQU5_9EUKA|nr:hypothetical protein BLNAU_23404 [Blattamonas nauphoetae]
MSTLTIVSSVEGWTMSDDAGDTVSLKCCASSFASLSSVGSVLEKDQQIVAALVNIIPSSENARSPRDPPHMTAEGSRFRVHPNSHLQEVCQNVSFRPIFDVTVTACTYTSCSTTSDTTFGVLSISHSPTYSTLRELGPMMVPPSPPTPVSKLMPQLFLGNEDTTSSIAVRFLLAVILLVRKFLNTQRITHVVICGTGTTSGSNVWNPSTFLASPAKHVSRVCSFLDKALDGDGVILVHSPQGHNRAMLILVSGACDGSDVAEPADSDEAIVRIVHSSQNVVQPGSATDSVCAECAYCSESEAPQLTGATSEPTSGTEPAGSILQSGDARRHRMPLKLAKTSPLLSQCAGTILGAPDDSGIDGSWKPKLSALRTIEQNALRRQGSAGHRSEIVGRTTSQSCDEFGPKYAIAEHTRQIRLDHSRTACPAAHTHTTLPAALLAPTAHPSVGSGLQHRPLSPLVAHTHKPPFASEGPRELERTAESCSCDDAPVLAREWDALAATLEASPKVGLAPHNPSHTLPLFPKIRQCAFCECEEENTDNTSREGEGCGCDEEAPFLIVSPIGLGGSAVVARSLSFARHYLAVLFCAESRCRFLFWQCLALCVLPVLACT